MTAGLFRGKCTRKPAKPVLTGNCLSNLARHSRTARRYRDRRGDAVADRVDRHRPAEQMAEVEELQPERTVAAKNALSVRKRMSRQPSKSSVSIPSGRRAIVLSNGAAASSRARLITSSSPANRGAGGVAGCVWIGFGPGCQQGPDQTSEPTPRAEAAPRRCDGSFLSCPEYLGGGG